jgi:dipeptidase D
VVIYKLDFSLINKFDNLDSKNVFKFFFEISKIPRESGNEKKISEYLVDFAAKRDFLCFSDRFNNVVIKKNATKNFESMPAIILQSHMDMVCVKSENSQHDFLNDGIEIIIDDDFLKSNNTTLGADNGIGLAAMLSILDCNDIQHPELECAFTSEEEIGMTGARNFEISLLNAKIFINLDSADSVIICGCSGSDKICINKDFKLSKNFFDSLYKIKISGLHGGHSAIDIDKNYANAIILMAQLLNEILLHFDVLIIDINSGTKENVIPSSGNIELTFDKKNYFKIINIIDKFKKEISENYADGKNIKIEIEVVNDNKDKEKFGIDKKYLRDILDLILIIPNGITSENLILNKMCNSSNIGILKIDHENKKALINLIMRSSSEYYRYFILKKLEKISNVLNFKMQNLSSSPIWEFKNDSRFLNYSRKIYQEIYDNNNNIFEFTSGGLETSFFKKLKSDLEIISIGPDIIDMHSINERVRISSVEKFYIFLKKLLSEIEKY